MQNPHISNPLFQRHLILHEFLDEEKTIYGGYKHLCKTLKKWVMSYEEYVFWFRRFENGLFDLDYDRSQDPEAKTFHHLPPEVVEKIIQKTSYEQMEALYDVSRSLREMLQKSRIVINESSIEIGEWYIRCKFDDDKWRYESDDDDSDSESDSWDDSDNEEKDERISLKLEEFVGRVVEDISIMTKKVPKLIINKLKIIQKFWDIPNGMESVFEDRDTLHKLRKIQLKVKKVECDMKPCFANPFLMMINPQTLEKLIYEYEGPDEDTFMTIQWYYVKYFEMKECQKFFPLKQLCNFKEAKLDFRNILWMFKGHSGEKTKHLEYAREAIEMYRNSVDLGYFVLSWGLGPNLQDIKSAAPEHGLKFLRRVKSDHKRTRKFEFERRGVISHLTIEWENDEHTKGVSKWTMTLKSSTYDINN